MKKLLLLIIITFSLNSQGQISGYHPLLDSVNRWSYIWNQMTMSPRSVTVNCNYPLGYDMNLMYTGSDTVLNSIKFKELFVNDYPFSNICLYGYIREDTISQKVYFLDVLGNNPVILYDFGMHISDSITLNFPFSQPCIGCYFENGIYKLDSIGNFTIQQGVRKVYYLNCISCNNSNTISWIEGVGNQGDLVYPYTSNYPSYGPFSNYCFEYPHNQEHFLGCFEHLQKIYFDSCAYQAAFNPCFAILDSCDYGNTCGSIPELNSKYSPVRFTPNPFHNAASIELVDLTFSNSEMIIYDNIGRLVHIMKITDRTTELDRQALNNGIYFYRIVNDNGRSAIGMFVIN